MDNILKRLFSSSFFSTFFFQQAGDSSFNRGMLLNIGFKEALRFNNYKCFIFHDVDLMPENDRNKYSCPSSPRHLSVAVDTFNYQQVHLDKHAFVSVASHPSGEGVITAPSRFMLPKTKIDALLRGQ